MIGRTLGHYTVVERLGAGGMGEVYRARDTRLERDVALKVLSATPGTSSRAAEALRKEALALSRLNHPHIAAVYDLDVVDEVTFVVMELVPGRDLQDRLRSGPLTEPEVLAVGLQVADALEAAHQAGIVHRDLKPANLRLTPEGRVKVLDFGLAARTAGRDDAAGLPTESATIHIAGTLPYMAPEQLRGRPPDPRSDVYSLCATIHELATGARPFAAATDAALIDQILNEPAPSARAHHPRTTSGLDAILQKGLEKDPARRYQSARELAVDLERLRTPSVPLRRPLPSLAGRVRMRRFVSVATVVVLGLIGAWLAWRSVASPPALAFAARDWILLADFENQTGEPVFDASLASAMTVGLAQSSFANLVPRARIESALQRMGRTGQPRIDEALGREICVREGVRGLVMPAIAKVGQQYALSARLIDPHTGEAVRVYFEQADTANEVLGALGRVADALRTDLGESLSSIRESSRPLPQVTTASIQALKSHADGIELWTRGKYDEAIVHHERAVELDADFAMAHAALGSAYLSFVFNDATRGRQHLDKALSLVDRTTERERMILQATYESQLGDRRRAVNLYQAFLFRYPDDAVMRYNFGGLLRQLRRFDDAVVEYREAIRLSPSNASAHVNLATALSQADRFTEALESYDRAFALEPTWKTASTNLNHEYGFLLVAADRPDEARKVFELALDSSEERPRRLRSLALLDLYQGRYRDAEPRLIEAVKLNEGLQRSLSAGRDLFFLAQLRGALGDRREQIAYLDRAMTWYKRARSRAFLVRAGAAYARLGQVNRAERVAEAAGPMEGTADPGESGDLARLEGEILVAKGDFQQALTRLEWADNRPGAQLEMTKEALGYALERAGDLDGALAAYEAFLGMAATTAGWEAQQPWLAAHYKVARIYADRGRTAEARAVLEKLLTRWREADPTLPLLQDARRLHEALR